MEMNNDKNKKTLVIMGTHLRSVQSFDWSRTDCEIWLFNEASTAKDQNGNLIFPKCDAVLQMHHESIWKSPENRSDKEHYNWLKSGKTPLVYMQEAYPEVPKAVRYPIEDVVNLASNVRMIINNVEKDFRFFSSTPDYALALAAYFCKKEKRYERVEVWGIALEMESEYIYQRLGFGFWFGYLAGLGIPLTINGTIFNEPMYGYEGDIAVSSKQIEERIAFLTSEIGDGKERYSAEAKVFLDGLSVLLKKNVAIEVEKKMNEIIKNNERTGILNGKIQESQRYLEKAKAMEATSGSSVFSPGEFDGNRLGCQKQYNQLRAEANTLNTLISMQLRKLLNLKKGSAKRKKTLDEFGRMVADLMNKNMLLLHLVGSVQENQYFLDSYKRSLRSIIESR